MVSENNFASTFRSYRICFFFFFFVDDNTERCISKEEDRRTKTRERDEKREGLSKINSIPSGNFLRSSSSCGSASAGIRPLVRESPSIKIHDERSRGRGLTVPGGEKKDERKNLSLSKRGKERERGRIRRDGRTAGRVTEATREHAHAYFASCTRVHVRIGHSGEAGPVSQNCKNYNARRRELWNKLAATFNTCFCTLYAYAGMQAVQVNTHSRTQQN